MTIKLNAFILLALLIICTLSLGYAQYTPPTLSGGIDNMIYSKGTIDVELLSALIISKQEELKKETIKRFILNDLNEGSSLVFYNFLSQILYVVLHENNKYVITKEITERVVNLAMVYSFIEFYLQVQWKIPEKRDVAFVELIEFCSRRPQYLGMNEQANWQNMFNNKIEGQQRNLLFSLKNSNKSDIENELLEIEGLNNQINKHFSSFNFCLISDELQNINKNLLLFQYNNPNYFNDNNIAIYPISDTLIFLKDLNTLFEQTKSFTTSSEAIHKNLNDFKTNLTKTVQNRYTGQNYNELIVFSESIKKLDSLILFVSTAHELEDKKDNNLYKFLNNRLLSHNTPSIKNTELYFKFQKEVNQFYSNIKMNSESIGDPKSFGKKIEIDSTQNIHKLYKSIFQEVIAAEVNFLKDNDFKSLSQAVLKSQYLSEISKSNYKSLFQEILKEQLFSSEINYGQDYIELDYSIIEKYNELVNLKPKLEHSFNQEFSIQKLLKLTQLSQSNEEKNTNNLLFSIFNQKIKNNSINKFQLFYDQLDLYLKSQDFYSEQYLDNNFKQQKNLFAEIDFSENKNYEDVIYIFDIIEAFNDEPKKLKKYFVDDKSLSTIQNIGLTRTYENMKSMLLAHDTLQISKRIHQLAQMNMNLDSIKQIENYAILPENIKESYENFIYKIDERIINEKESIDFRYTFEYKNFIHELVKWKITQEKEAILKHIEVLENDWINFYAFKEYQKLNNEWSLHHNTSKLNEFAQELNLNDAISNQIVQFTALKNTPLYKAFNENIDKYKNLLNKNLTYIRLLEAKKTIETLPKYSLDFDNRQTLLNYTEWIIFRLQFVELNRVKKILEQLNEEYRQIIPLNMILLDMVYDICYNNLTIQKTGFFNESKQMDIDKYNNANTFLSLQEKDPEFYNYLANLRKTMEKKIEMFFNFYQLIQELDYFKGQNLDEIRNNYIEQIKNSMNDTLKLKRYNNSMPFVETSHKINILETIFNTADKLFVKIQKQVDKIEYIDERILFYKKNEKIKTSLITKTSDNEDFIKELKIKTSFVATDSIISSAKMIVDLLANMPADYKIQSYEDQLISTLKHLSFIETFDYQESYAIDKKIFIDTYEIRNDTILNATTLLKAVLDKYKRDILAKLLSKNDYIGFNLAIFKQSIQNFDAEELTNEDKEILAQVYSYTSNLEKPGNNYINIELISHLRSKIIPQLVAINIKYKPQRINEDTKFEQINYPISSNLISVEAIENILNYAYFMNINSFYDPENMISPEIIKLSTQFIDLVSRLNKLDEVETYALFFKALNDIGNILPDNKAINTFNNFTNSILKHTILNKESNTIQFDVESFILLFYEQYKNISISNWSLYFSIGLNQASFFKNVSFTTSDTTQYTLKNIAFASEKIGIKYTLINFNERIMHKQQNDFKKYYTTKPIISDWHLISYGTGLLYNIVNSTTDKNHFNLPMVGIGTGLTFYNSLDFNLFYNIPFTKNAFQKSMVGFSFDIKIGEYISELNKQRKLQKIKKSNL